MRKFFQIIYYAGGAFLFIFFAVIGYTQTRTFKTYLRNTILNESKTALNGELRFGEITGNLLTGFSVDSISLYGLDDEVFSSDHIEFKYDILGFIFKRIAVSQVVIEKPRINIYSTADGGWNISRLLKSASTDTTPFSWTIDIKKLELQDAELSYTDSLLLYERQTGESELPPDNVIDYAHIHLTSLFLGTSIKIQDADYQINLNNLAFISNVSDDSSAGIDKYQNPGKTFVLKHLGGELLLTKNEVSVKNLSIETLRSEIKLDAGMKDVDIASLVSLEELKLKPVNIRLSANGLDTKELKQLLYPYVDFLDGSLKLDLKAGGTFGNLEVANLAVKMPNSHVQLEGYLRNLHSPRKLEMTIKSDDNIIVPQDLKDCLPGLNLPDFSFLGPVKYSVNYEGRPLDFKAHILCSAAAGNFDLDGKLNIASENPAYSGSIRINSLTLDTLFHNRKLTSNLNARITVAGTGFDPHSMTGQLKLEMDSSSFHGLSVQSSVFMFDIAGGFLRSNIAAAVGNGNYELSGLLSFLKNDSSGYNIEAKIRSLDLAELLENNKYSSSLSFDLTGSGAAGKTGRSDTLDLNFYHSLFRGEEFDSGEANVVFTLRDSLRSNLNVTSTVGDLEVSGRFSPASFISAWENSFKLVTDAVAHRFRTLDSLRSDKKVYAETPEFQPSRIKKNVSIESHFRLNVNDFRPVGLIIDVPLYGWGFMQGTIAGDSTALQFIGDMNLRQFELYTGRDTLTADTAMIQYFFSGINPQTIFKTFDASIEADLHDFSFNGFNFNDLAGRLNVKSDSSNFHFSTLIDSTARVKIAGETRVNAGLMKFEIPELQIALGDYAARNAGRVKLDFGQDGFRVNSLVMAHESEEVLFSGYFSPTGISDLNILLNRFLLSNLKHILYRGSYAKSPIQFDGQMDASASFSGSFKSPNIIVDLNADGVRALDTRQNRSQELGKIVSHLAYSDYVLKLLVKLTGRPDDLQAPPDMLFSGSLPYEFVLARTEPHNLEGEVDLIFKAEDLDLRFLDPFIPEISDLSGRMACDMKMKGPIDAPEYEGSMSIRQADLIFEPLGLRYTLNGNLIPAGDKIQLENFTIQNDPMELQHVGSMKVSGSFTLHGLNINYFDILAQGDLKVMRQDKRQTGQKIYGDLFAATGPNGLSWEGNLDNSTVRGDVFVRDAQLVLPPDREIEFVSDSFIDVKFLDDTSQAAAQLSKVDISKNGRNRGLLRNGRENAASELSSSSLAQEEKSFLDGINYDVNIETQGPTTLRFVFNTQTSEELFADLNGRLYFNKTPEVSRLTGQVDAGSRSYYNFIKRFEASGNILFTGDVLNPELDITATYEGRHDSVNQSQVYEGCGPEQAHQVQVTLIITGTRNEPKTKITLHTKVPPSRDWNEWQCGDEEGNAMAFIFTGQYRSELTNRQRTDAIGSNLGSSLGLAFASGIFTGPLSDAIRKNFWGGFQSIDVLYYGGRFDQSADIRLTGQVGEAVIRAGGYVFTGDIGNINYSVELPMSYVIGVDRLRNLILTLERRVEGIQNVEEQRRASNGVRLFYRFTF